MKVKNIKLPNGDILEINSEEIENQIDKIETSLDEVNEKIDAVLPSQTDSSGKFLKTNGIQPYWSEYDALEENRISNCAIEIPQRIKLTLKNGALTLNAGSIVTIPNGFEADGTTPKCDYVEVKNDLTWAPGMEGIAGNTYGLFYDNTTNSVKACNFNSQAFSSETKPTPNSNTAFWYDRANNVIKTTTNNWTNTVIGSSFPVCTFTLENSLVQQIVQVFNGIGYIDGVTWIDKGVTVLIPNGLNEDGTFNNVKYTTERLMTEGAAFNGSFTRTMFYDFNMKKNAGAVYYYNQITPPVLDSTKTQTWYNPATNQYYWHSTKETQWTLRPTYRAVLGRVTSVNARITEMIIYPTFKAVSAGELDALRNEYLTTANNFENTVKITTTYVNGTSGYRVWSDGFCEQWGQRGAITGEQTLTINLLRKYSNTNYVVFETTIKNANTGYAGSGAVVKGSSKTTSSFQLIQDTFTDNGGFWMTMGY